VPAMTVPNGEPVPMGQFTLGPRYDVVDLARDCGCPACQDIVAAHERRMAPFTDTIAGVLESANLSVTCRRWPE
jgi:hypothetical protein